MNEVERGIPIGGTEVVINADCERSSRRAWLRDFNLAFINGDVEATLEYVTEDVEWTLVGEVTIGGREGMRDWFGSMAGKKARKVVLDRIIVHEDAAAVDGSYEMESGSKFAFCDIYEFSGTGPDEPISKYTSYVIRS
ncbi:MAG: nuclear transport factor 2 family protein [Solirubrobacterales bacterium]|nr:nuclear transport factor 2 family protein [Solirubrobacterales bacterium]HMT06182.1 nuclear transport factor 2 family protein [Solirubrobacterales bacterium]